MTTTEGGDRWLVFLLTPAELDGKTLLLVQVAEAPAGEAPHEAHHVARSLRSGLADLSDDLLFSLDRDLKVTELNQAAASALGGTPSQFVGRHISELGVPAEYSRGWQGKCARVVQSGRPAERLRNTFTLADGRTHVNETSLYPIRGADGQVVGLQGVVCDITDVREAQELVEASERRYQLLADTTSDIMFSYDTEFVVQAVNRAAAESIRLDAEQAVGFRLDEIGAPEATVAKWKDMTQRVLDSHEAVEEVVELEMPGGQVRIFESVVRPMQDDTGTIVGFRGEARDITEQREVEQTLKDREARLRQAQKMEAVGQLAGGMAHDFNNVLTTIIGYSDLALASEHNLDASLVVCLREIRAAADRASAVTRQVLAFSRRQALRPEVLNLNDVIDGAAQVLRSALGESIAFITSLGPDLGLVEVDPNQIEQVLLNLALNARDAMPGGGKLVINTADVEIGEKHRRAHPEHLPGRYVEVSVADTGVGMDEETVSRIFEPFFTTKAPDKGTGLGLASVYGTIKQSGGYIYARSRPGRGSIFTIHLPVVDKPATQKEHAAGLPEIPLGSGTILVVEDEEAVLKLVLQVLEGLGYQVLSAGSGDEALKIIKKASVPIDLMLSDMVLPGHLQGYDLVQEARERRPHLRVVCMSGYDRDAVARSAGIDQGVGFLEKPFTTEQLADTIRQELERGSGPE